MTEYELTRRDALAALGTVGAATAGVLTWDGDDGGAFSAHQRETLTALARTLYPSDVTGVADFVETYVVGRVRDRPERLEGMVESLAYLDEYALEWRDERFLELSPSGRDDLLEEMGADVVDPDPAGIGPARLRFYLVNELLYALYTSPTGARLVGLENPQGYPGGTESYRRGPGE